MKKRDKWMLGVGAIAIGLGLAIGSAGLAVSAKSYDQEFSGQEPEYYQKEVTGVDSIQFDISYGDVYVSYGSRFSISVQNDKENSIESRVVDGVWKVTSTKRSISVFDFLDILAEDGFHGFHNNYPEIMIEVPEGTVFRDASISIGAGSVTMQGLSATKARLSVGTGSFTLEEIQIRDSIHVDIGTGEFGILSGALANLDLECGVGSATVIGTYITGNNKIESGIGSIEMELLNREEDCYYTVDCGIGTVIINDRSYSDGSKVGNKNAKNKFELENGIGEIDVWNRPNSTVYDMEMSGDESTNNVTEIEQDEDSNSNENVVVEKSVVETVIEEKSSN